MNRSMTHLQCSYKWSQPTETPPVGHVLTSLLPFPLMWMGGGVITAVFFICRACGLFLKTLLLSLKDRENIPVNAAFVQTQNGRSRLNMTSSYSSVSGIMGGKVCLRSLAWPRLLSEHVLRTLSWSESTSCMLSRA